NSLIIVNSKRRRKNYSCFSKENTKKKPLAGGLNGVLIRTRAPFRFNQYHAVGSAASIYRRRRIFQDIDRGYVVRRNEVQVVYHHAVHHKQGGVASHQRFHAPDQELH